MQNWHVELQLGEPRPDAAEVGNCEPETNKDSHLIKYINKKNPI